MKTLSIYAAILFSIFNTQFSFAQKGPILTSTANIKVWGNCESCKNRIEAAAQNAGATAALWNEETQNLTVSFNPSKTSTDKIEKAIAAKGHDTQNFAATDGVYNKLPGCCKYERTRVATATPTDMSKCCVNEKCTDMASCKAMATCKDMACCKGKKCCAKDSHQKQDGTMKCDKDHSCCKKA